MNFKYIYQANRDRYGVFECCVPKKIMGRIAFLKKYFKALDEDIPYKYKRRKDPIECIESALMILARINVLFLQDIPIIVGSAFLAPKPWATFGNIVETASLDFKDFFDISSYYHNIIMNNGYEIERFYFKNEKIIHELSNNYEIHPDYIISMAICLLYDLIINCGPDCEEIYDIFTNDTRVSSEFFDLNEWEDLRYYMLGDHGKINSKPYKIKLGQPYKPHIPLVSQTRFHERPKSNKIADGEKVKIYPKIIKMSDVCLAGEKDETVKSPETDLEYQQSIKDRLYRYDALGLNLSPSYI